MKKINFLFILVLLSSFAIKAQDFKAPELDCYKVDAATFNIDGVDDEPFWNNDAIKWINIDKNTVEAAPPSASDYSAKFKVAYDDDYLYVFLRIVDDKLFKWADNGGNYYNADNIEFFFNPSGIPASLETLSWDATRDSQLRCNMGSDGLATGGGFCVTNAIDGMISGYDYTHKMTANGYDVEVMIPWYAVITDAYMADIVPGGVIGFDVNCADVDETPTRDHIMSWSTPNTDNWRYNAYYGFMNFKDEIKAGINAISKSLNYVFADNKLQFNNLNGKSKVAVYNVFGQTLINTETENNTIDFSTMTSGIYIVKVQDLGGTYTAKITK